MSKQQSPVEWLESLYYPEYIPKEVFEQAKEKEIEENRKSFVNGYKARAELGNKVFDEISEASANLLFEQQLKTK
jgi:hypothetical protein